jgi:twitching motility protein PilT
VARIDALFEELLRRGGSDLHLGIGYPPLARWRGELVPLRDAPVDATEIESLLFEILNEGQARQISQQLDLDFAHSYGDKARFRANYFYKLTGLAAVFRTVPAGIQTLDQLGCPEAVRKLAERRAGLVLVTGPTGSGKSTTLAAMLHHVNQTRACHILTIEDPVEFVHEPIRSQVSHREVRQHASSFAAAIRSAGRENADVILVGELRTNETMRLALELAGTGVLVFATVHTNSAPQTIDRIVNAFTADEQPAVRGMLAEALAGVIAQQLLRTADGVGRVAAQEILLATPALAEMIREGKTMQIPGMMQVNQGLGMQTMDMALERLVGSGKVTEEDALAKAVDRDALARAFGRS